MGREMAKNRCISDLEQDRKRYKNTKTADFTGDLHNSVYGRSRDRVCGVSIVCLGECWRSYAEIARFLAFLGDFPDFRVSAGQIWAGPAKLPKMTKITENKGVSQVGVYGRPRDRVCGVGIVCLGECWWSHATSASFLDFLGEFCDLRVSAGQFWADPAKLTKTSKHDQS